MMRTHLRQPIAALMFLIFTVATATAQDAWLIHAPQVEADGYHGATVANGMLGISSSPQPLRLGDIIMAGSYDHYGRGGVDNILKAVGFMDMNLRIDGREARFAAHSQTLDMRRARIQGECEASDKLHLIYNIYALRQLPHCALVEVAIAARGDARITLCNRHAANEAIPELHTHYSTLNEPGGRAWLLTSEGTSAGGRLRVGASSTFVAGDGAQVDYDAKRQEERLTATLRAGDTLRVALVGACLTTAQHPDPANEAERMAIYAALQGTENLVQQHIDEWARLWQSDILIEGDAQAQQDVHQMIFHLYGSVREGTHLSIPPMGLTCNGYNGHIFWDADLWMFPALLMLQPQLARQLVEYRIDRLPEARRRASAYGYQGAMFPWESSDTGDEQTPAFALTGPQEHHITGCVALTAWNYFRATGDTLWLRQRAMPLLRETARFWLSRISTDPSGHHIRHVVCPDEWAMNVDDNAFTNAIAMLNIRIARQADSLLALRRSSDEGGVATDASWRDHEVPQLPIPTMGDSITREHASYDGQPVKQADVSLLAYPLGAITDGERIRRDMEYYIRRIPREGTPAMSNALFALLYARLGDTREAMRHWQEGFRPYLCGPFRTMAEERGGHNPYFLTGAGGLLQAIIMGFGGYDITDRGIEKRPTVLPDGWQSLSILSPLTTRTGDVRIAVVSDPHVQDVLQHPELLRTMESQVRSTRLFNENIFSLRAALDDVERRGIRLVVMPGDLTDNGQMITNEAVARLLREYTARGMRFFLSTGNHDPNTPVNTHWGQKDFLTADGRARVIYSDTARFTLLSKPDEVLTPDTVMPALHCSGYDELLSLWRDFGFAPQPDLLYWATPFSTYNYDTYCYAKAVVAARPESRRYGTNLTDASYLCEPVEGLWLLSIDGSVHTLRADGRWNGSWPGYVNVGLYKPFLQPWVAQVTAEARRRGKRLITFSHYPLVDFNRGATDIVAQAWGKDKFDIPRVPPKELTRSFFDAGLRLHIGGHMHLNDTGVYSDSLTGDGLVNVQIPSTAGYKPAYKILTLSGDSLCQVETVPIADVPGFRSFFPLYEKEWQSPDRWDKRILQAQDFEAFCDFYFADLVRLRFIPKELPAVLRDHLSDIGGPGWNGHDLMLDLFRLRFADRKALDDIPAERLQAYDEFFSSLDPTDHSPLNEQLLALRAIMRCMRSGHPSDRFTVDMRHGRIVSPPAAHSHE